ncbi:PREDICTED: coiled-coil domain-containing protein 57-like [Priapulus caudatus]|uniref:Coiled-coil domain-containing protein 57-like n=1 Tax=Priapulus caudatus TaxID=37621 RepID=A0ABM1EW87_PRICU|nr:PREDICTED: coiled-coil domain-containing protein 57-like [Priapulus caudatus]
MLDAPETADIQEQLDQKEREWKQLLEKQMKSLDTAYKEKNKQNIELQTRFDKLSDDFKFNLKVVEERDEDLSQYEVALKDAQAQVTDQKLDLSECRIKIEELQQTLANEQVAKTQLQSDLCLRLRGMQADQDAYRSERDAEEQKERKQMEVVRRDLHRQVAALQVELQTQRRELAANYADAARKREHEVSLELDELSATLLSYQSQVKMLSRERDSAAASKQELAEQLEAAEVSSSTLEQQLRKKQWEADDQASTKDATVLELQGRLEQMEHSIQQKEDELVEKHRDVDEFAKEKELAVVRAKEAHAEIERNLRDNERHLQEELHNARADLRRLERENADLRKDKETEVERLRVEVARVTTGGQNQLAELSRSIISKDTQLAALKQEAGVLRCELTKRKDDIERYKADLSAAAEREAEFEQSKEKLTLDWQKRCETAENRRYASSEKLVQRLSKARDECLTTLKEREKILQQLRVHVKLLTSERDSATATLKYHGIPLLKDHAVEASDTGCEMASSEAETLRRQNENLRTIIKQMRVEMESLPLPEKQVPQAAALSHQDISTPTNKRRLSDGKSPEAVGGAMSQRGAPSLQDRVSELEREMHNRPCVAPDPAADAEAALKNVDSAIIHSHVQQLNDTIGKLRGEKVHQTAQLRKQQVRIAHLESQVQQLEHLPRESQVEIDQLRPPAAGGGRTAHAGAVVRCATARTPPRRGSRRRARRPRPTIAACWRATEKRGEYVKEQGSWNNLGFQSQLPYWLLVFNLKMNLSNKMPSCNFGAQELVIQQLQDELGCLRTMHASLPVTMAPSVVPPSENSSVEAISRKLKLALEQIQLLSMERDKLLEMGNRLRSELYTLKEERVVDKADKAANTVLSSIEPRGYTQTKQVARGSDGDASIPLSSRLAPEKPLSQRVPQRGARSGARSAGRVAGPGGVSVEPLLFSVSSGGSSLQEVWRLVERGESPSIVTPAAAEQRATRAQSCRDVQHQANLKVKGKKSDLVTKSALTKKIGSKQKLRNYNIKSDG